MLVCNNQSRFNNLIFVSHEWKSMFVKLWVIFSVPVNGHSPKMKETSLKMYDYLKHSNAYLGHCGEGKFYAFLCLCRKDVFLIAIMLKLFFQV